MSKLNDINLIQSLDKSGMDHKIIHMPEHIYLSYTEPIIHQPSLFSEFNFNEIKQIVICGMGGSAISADIAQVLYNRIMPITVVKDYKMPSINSNTLCIIISYSGNTEESVECLKQAMSLTPYVAAVTSGGLIKEMIDSTHLWIEVPGGFPPRAAIGYLFFSLIKILEIFEIISDKKEIAKSVAANLMQKAGTLCLKTETNKNLAKSSAEAIYPRIPVIYSSNPVLSPVAYRWKCQINENAKHHAFFHSFPEMNHNEIEAWESKNYASNFIPVFLRFFNEDQKYLNRVKIFQSILVEQKIDFLEFYGDGDSDLCKIFTLIYLGDMISYYLGILNNFDPTEINFINHLKNKLSKL